MGKEDLSADLRLDKDRVSDALLMGNFDLVYSGCLRVDVGLEQSQQGQPRSCEQTSLYSFPRTLRASPVCLAGPLSVLAWLYRGPRYGRFEEAAP